MIPTIDIGLISAVSVFLTFLGKCWSYIVAARDFVLKNIALVVLGSRVWATTFFVGIIVAVMALESAAVSKLAGKLGGWAWERVTYNNDFQFETSILQQAFPFEDMIAFLSFGTVQLGFYLGFVSNIAFFKKCFNYFLGVVAAWKT